MIKVIYIMNWSPKYAEYEDKPRPPWTWENDKGEWLGVWGYDWGDLIGLAVTERAPDITFEIWQTDLRADKVYTAQLSERVVHKLYPATIRYAWNGIRINRYVSSDEVICECMQQQHETLFLFGAVETTFINRLYKRVKRKPHARIHWISTKLLLPPQVFSANPLVVLNRIRLSTKSIQNLKRIKHLICGQNYANSRLQKYNSRISVHDIGLGQDLKFWEPVISKEAARVKLSFRADEFVIVLSQRLVPEYQIDKFINVLAKLHVNTGFRVIITGHGLPDYERYLRALPKQMGLEERIDFVGRISDEELRDLFTAADLFATVPIMFAGSNGAIKAMIAGTPIFHVTEGSTYMFLKEHNAGVLVSPDDYDAWRRELEQIIDGRKKTHCIPKELVFERFDWDGVAPKWIELIRSLAQRRSH